MEISNTTKPPRIRDPCQPSCTLASPGSRSYQIFYAAPQVNQDAGNTLRLRYCTCATLPLQSHKAQHTPLQLAYSKSSAEKLPPAVHMSERMHLGSNTSTLRRCRLAIPGCRFKLSGRRPQSWLFEWSDRSVSAGCGMLMLAALQVQCSL